MIGRGSPNYFGSLFNPEDEVFSRSILGARQGLTGQAGQIASFAGAQKAQQDQMASLVQMAQQQAAQQQQQLQQSAQVAQTAAERERQNAIAEQNSRLQRQQWQAEFDARKAQTEEELALRRNQEEHRLFMNTPQPIYADYRNAFTNGGTGNVNPYQSAIQSGKSPLEAYKAAQTYYQSMGAGTPGSNIYIIGYAKPQQ